MDHKAIGAGEMHVLENWTYANAAARTGASGFVAADVGKIAYQTDTGVYYRLTATTPTWAVLGVAAGSVTLAMLADMATASVLGRTTAGTGVPEVLSNSQVRAILGLSTTSSPTFAGFHITSPTQAICAFHSAAGGSGFGFGRSYAATDLNDFFIYDYVNNATRFYIGVTGGVKIGAATDPGANNLSVVGTIAGSNLSGTNTGDQTITLTGDVTGTGTGSFAATIANSAVTLAKMADMASLSFIGRQSIGTGVPEVVSSSSARTMLGLATTSTPTFAGIIISNNSWFWQASNFGIGGNWAGFSAESTPSLGGYALLSDANTGTYLNNKTGGEVGLRINNTTYFKVTSALATLSVPIAGHTIAGTLTIAPTSGAVSFIGKIPTTADYAQFGFQNPLGSQRGFFGYIGAAFSTTARQDHFEIGTTTSTHIYFRPGDSGNLITMFSSGGLSVGTFAVDPGANNIHVQGVYKVGTNQVVAARDTGWTAMTGANDKATAYAVASVTLAQLAGRVMQLQASLTTHGLIGA